jgi:hypothetical protein
MRIPPNLKYVFLFLLFIGIIVLGVFYVPKWIPNIGQILTWIFVGFMMILIVGVVVRLFFTFIYARTDGIFEVYRDAAGKGFHVFGHHTGTSPEFGDAPRDIQHYYISYDKGKVRYKQLFSHSMTPASGRSGWEGFYSFEENVLKGKQLPVSLQKFSKQTGLQLGLNEKIKEKEDDHYLFEAGNITIEIKKFEQALDEGFRVVCRDKTSGKIKWKIKI